MDHQLTSSFFHPRTDKRKERETNAGCLTQVWWELLQCPTPESLPPTHPPSQQHCVRVRHPVCTNTSVKPEKQIKFTTMNDNILGRFQQEDARLPSWWLRSSNEMLCRSCTVCWESSMLGAGFRFSTQIVRRQCDNS